MPYITDHSAQKDIKCFIHSPDLSHQVDHWEAKLGSVLACLQLTGKVIRKMLPAGNCVRC